MVYRGDAAAGKGGDGMVLGCSEHTVRSSIRRCCRCKCRWTNQRSSKSVEPITIETLLWSCSIEWNDTRCGSLQGIPWGDCQCTDNLT